MLNSFFNKVENKKKGTFLVNRSNIEYCMFHIFSWSREYTSEQSLISISIVSIMKNYIRKY